MAECIGTERWVNAVITVRIPMNVSPDASLEAQRDAAVSTYERHVSLSDESVATIGVETVEG